MDFRARHLNGGARNDAVKPIICFLAGKWPFIKEPYVRIDQPYASEKISPLPSVAMSPANRRRGCWKSLAARAL